jgi:hypothetical protein
VRWIRGLVGRGLDGKKLSDYDRSRKLGEAIGGAIGGGFGVRAGIGARLPRVPTPSPNFKPPTNPPDLPPTDLPPESESGQDHRKGLSLRKLEMVTDILFLRIRIRTDHPKGYPYGN